MPAIWLGDPNVAQGPIDVYHPDHRVNGKPDFKLHGRQKRLGLRIRVLRDVPRIRVAHS